MEWFFTECWETGIDLIRDSVIQLYSYVFIPFHLTCFNIFFDSWPRSKVTGVSITIDNRFSSVIIHTHNTFIDISIHMACDNTSCQCSRLSNTMIKETTSWIKQGTIQTVQVNLFNQLSLVPKCSVYFVFFFDAFTHLGLHVLTFSVPTFQQARDNAFGLVAKDSSVGT